MMRNKFSSWFVAIVTLLLLVVPVYAGFAGEPFALTFVSRILIFALAATPAMTP